jgi:hypothetical protein
MDVTFHAGFGNDLNLTAELTDADPGEAVSILGSICNEVLRMNMALVMQEETG